MICNMVEFDTGVDGFNCVSSHCFMSTIKNTTAAFNLSPIVLASLESAEWLRL